MSIILWGFLNFAKAPAASPIGTSIADQMSLKNRLTDRKDTDIMFIHTKMIGEKEILVRIKNGKTTC